MWICWPSISTLSTPLNCTCRNRAPVAIQGRASRITPLSSTQADYSLAGATRHIRPLRTANATAWACDLADNL